MSTIIVSLIAIALSCLGFVTGNEFLMGAGGVVGIVNLIFNTPSVSSKNTETVNKCNCKEKE